MKEFNLKQALNGAKLITRDGEEVTEFKQIISENGIDYPYEAMLGFEAVCYTENGKYWADNTASPRDLFIA